MYNNNNKRAKLPNPELHEEEGVRADEYPCSTELSREMNECWHRELYVIHNEGRERYFIVDTLRNRIVRELTAAQREQLKKDGFSNLNKELWM